MDGIVEEQAEISDEEAILKIAEAMKDNASVVDEKNNVHTFLHNVAIADDTTKLGNLRDDKDINELGLPQFSVRGSKELARIARSIIGNEEIAAYFDKVSEDTLATSLSREGFLEGSEGIYTISLRSTHKRGCAIIPLWHGGTGFEILEDGLAAKRVRITLEILDED